MSHIVHVNVQRLFMGTFKRVSKEFQSLFKHILEILQRFVHRFLRDPKIFQWIPWSQVVGSKTLSDTIEGGYCIIEGGGRPAGRPAGGCNLSRLRYVHSGRGGSRGASRYAKGRTPWGGRPHCKRKRDGRWDHQKVYRFQTGCSPAQSSPAQPSPVSQAAGQPVGEK